MSEQTKKRIGRPTNAERAAKAALMQSMQLNGDATRSPQSVIEEQQMPQTQEPSAQDVLAKAQAYALRVWNGQSNSLGRGERIARVRRAIEGQGFAFEGVVLPGSPDDDNDWTEADYAPVTFRTSRAA